MSGVARFVQAWMARFFAAGSWLWLLSLTNHVRAQVTTCTSATNNEACFPDAWDVASGCASSSAVGQCVLGIGGTSVCSSYETAPAGTACELAGCACLAGNCFVSDYTEYCDEPSAEACTDSSDCNNEGGEMCCPVKKVCEVPVTSGAYGDPHMTGFRGQKFDFTGEDGEWYCVLDDGPALHVNMRVTSPVAGLPEISYITGLSITTTDDVDGFEHTIVIVVTDPHNLDSVCPPGLTPCLADGALSVEVDGNEVLLAPGTFVAASDVAVSAVNLPGVCRTVGFEGYRRRKLGQAQTGRKLRVENGLEDMADWIIDDPTITNMAECEEYVAAVGENGLFTQDSDHALFQILTPLGAIRLSHERLHQLPVRDPTDRLDVPDHVAWQMNLAIEHHGLNLDAKGILGGTLVPTTDDKGEPIMQGMGAIRGKQDDYRVQGPLGSIFAQGRIFAQGK